MKIGKLAGFWGFLLLVQINHAGWIKTYGDSLPDYGFWVEQTSDKGYILTGSLMVDTLVDRVYLIKTDSAGDTLWTRTYSGGEGPWEINNVGRCVQEVSDGGYVVIATRGHPAKPWLFRFDENGDTLWTRTYYEVGKWCWCIRQTLDGGYIIIGGIAVNRNDTIDSDLWIMKTDSVGDTLWTRTYGTGGEDHEAGFSIQVVSDGGFIATGYGPGNGLWVLRTDSEGDTLWTRNYELGNPERSNVGHEIEPTSDGGWIITGATDYGGPITGALCLLKIDSQGDTLWIRSYDCGSAVESGQSVKQTPDGGYIVAGVKDYSMVGTGLIWLLKTDSLGDTLWTRTYGGGLVDKADCIQLTEDGGYIITGNSKSFSPDGSTDVLLMKTDSLGRVVGVEEEPPVVPLTRLSDWQISTSIGPQITLHYANHPEGFHASVFDALGRKVDEIHAAAESGTITWPAASKQFSPWVYFFKDNEGSVVQKTVLIR